MTITRTVCEENGPSRVGKHPYILATNLSLTVCATRKVTCCACVKNGPSHAGNCVDDVNECHNWKPYKWYTPFSRIRNSKGR